MVSFLPQHLGDQETDPFGGGVAEACEVAWPGQGTMSLADGFRRNVHRLNLDRCVLFTL